MAQNHIGLPEVVPLPFTNRERSRDANFYPDLAKNGALGSLLNTDAVRGRRHQRSLSWAGIANTHSAEPCGSIDQPFITELLPFAMLRRWSSMMP